MAQSVIRAPLLAAFSALLLCCCGGCGPQRTTEVSGTVKLKGKAPNLQGLRISFFSENGEPVSTDVNPDGSYRAVGVPIGTVRVTLVHLSPEGAEARKAAAQARKPKAPSDEGAGDSTSTEKKAVQRGKDSRNPYVMASGIPERYSDAMRSQLTFVVEAGKANIFDVDLID
jgi:hypothetical protein